MSDNQYELLELCGFEKDEIEKEKPRIEKTFQKLCLTSEDMKKAITWVRKYHDIELVGARKILRLWLKELIDLVLAREERKKLVYYGYPTIAGLGTTLVAADSNVYATCPDVVLCFTMGQIFNKLSPILEAGEANGLPAGHSLCSLQQIRVGSIAKGITPVADMVFTSSYYCDMGSKTDELLHEQYGHPAVYCDGCIDSKWGEYPDFLPERIDFLGFELEKALSGAEKILGIKITDEARRKGLTSTDQVFHTLNELNDLVDHADPQPVSSITLQLANLLTRGSASKRLMVESPDAIKLLIEELRERIKKGIGVIEKGAPRVAPLMVHFSDPSVTRMMEDCGLAMPLSIIAVAAKKSLTSIPYISGRNLAEREMLRGVFHSTSGLIDQAVFVAKQPNVDGIIWNYLFNCRPVAQASHLLKHVVEKETNTPVLALEMDVYDSRSYSPGGLRTRVETFAEMLKVKKATI